MSTFDPTLAIKLETALYADDFMRDFDALLRITGTTLRLVWDGERNRDCVTLWLVYDGKAAPLAMYRPEWLGMRWVSGVAKVEDFRERLQKLLALHRAEPGLGISHVKKIARFNVGFPTAPRLNNTDVPLSRRVIYTRRSPERNGRPCCGEYAPREEAA